MTHLLCVLIGFVLGWLIGTLLVYADVESKFIRWNERMTRLNRKYQQARARLTKLEGK